MTQCALKGAVSATATQRQSVCTARTWRILQLLRNVGTSCLSVTCNTTLRPNNPTYGWEPCQLPWASVGGRGGAGGLKIRDSSTMWGPILHRRSAVYFRRTNRRVSALRASRVSEQYSITAQTRSSWSGATDSSRTSESQASRGSEQDIRLQNRLDLRDQMRPIRSRTSESQASLPILSTKHLSDPPNLQNTVINTQN
jgi:hypothetical protein